MLRNEPFSNLNSERFSQGMNVQAKSTKLLPKLMSRGLGQVEDIPSQISADEWGEVQKYGHLLNEDAKTIERQKFFEK